MSCGRQNPTANIELIRKSSIQVDCGSTLQGLYCFRNGHMYEVLGIPDLIQSFRYEDVLVYYVYLSHTF